MKMAIASSVAVFTALFVIALITTFNFRTWNGIERYASEFKPIQLLTVIPSILLAISFLILE